MILNLVSYLIPGFIVLRTYSALNVQLSMMHLKFDHLCEDLKQGNIINM
ncbi:uncharacterized protein DC041_0001360 [Schistosoma bovis]|uniref:Uncharacterized protein n=1 Tax=Schistosoma bovis TaxID=6184 RepID=A0A430QKM0_SCHBO|nr:uncharacterized protein DC041_0001360 [Schistosoma bovis]